jgi:hypothetical protein
VAYRVLTQKEVPMPKLVVFYAMHIVRARRVRTPAPPRRCIG